MHLHAASHSNSNEELLYVDWRPRTGEEDDGLDVICIQVWAIIG